MDKTIKVLIGVDVELVRKQVQKTMSGYDPVELDKQVSLKLKEMEIDIYVV